MGTGDGRIELPRPASPTVPARVPKLFDSADSLSTTSFTYGERLMD